MASLGQTAQSVSLGNGSVRNLQKNAINRRCGETILSKVAESGYARENLKNNYIFFNSNFGAVDYGYDRLRQDIYGIDNFGWTYKGPSVIPYMGIGDVYYLRERPNSNKWHISINERVELASVIRESNLIRNYIGNNFITNRFVSNQTGISLSGDLFTHYVVPSEPEVMSNYSKTHIGDIGLLEYNSGVLESYVYSPQKGIRYPWDYISGDYTFWNINRPYGLYQDDLATPEVFSLNNDKSVPSTVIITDEFKGTTKTSSYDATNNITRYKFYEETSKGTPRTSFTEDIHITQGSSVAIDGMTNASRLLRRTNQLFRESKINSLINRFHTDKGLTNGGIADNSYDKNFGLSRGRNLIAKPYEGKAFGDDVNGYDNPYCRVWTSHHQYSKLSDRIRPFYEDAERPRGINKIQSNFGDLRPNGGIERLADNTVLRDDGYVNITPTFEETKVDSVKNYMFSIENLAWKDIAVMENSTALSNEQKGPNNGRIMWFPPYNLKFSENTNAEWNQTNFIGRGEKIYTYVNTERTGTLSFTLLVDHPSVINKWRGTDAINEGEEKEERQRDFLRYFAGCWDINDDIKEEKTVESKKELPQEVTIEPEPVVYSQDIAYVVFFPNNFSANDYLNGGDISEAIEILRDYNTGGAVTDEDDSYADEILQEYNQVSDGFIPEDEDKKVRETLFGGPSEDLDVHYFTDLENLSKEFTGTEIFGHPIETCEITGIEIKGFASNHGYEKNNKTLCSRRSRLIEKMLSYESVALDKNNVTYTELPGKIITVPDIDGRKYINSLDAKIARSAYAIIHVSWKETNTANANYTMGDDVDRTVTGVNFSNATSGTEETTETANIITETREEMAKKYAYDNEYLYFSNIRSDSLVYKNILDKIRYFNPAFHSITPEGFNARLTFLHQCTRQGPTMNSNNGNVNSNSSAYLKYGGNLSFGRPPYCILRIGDFYNTKIIINSISYNFDTGGGPQFDLNPEGIGVQPMFADVNISFTFLGGQDITGPIERLQNAVTSNYYANTSVYSRHADTNTYYYDVWKNKKEDYKSDTGTTTQTN